MSIVWPEGIDGGSGGWVRGRPRLGWMDGMKVALGNRNDGGGCASMSERLVRV